MAAAWHQSNVALLRSQITLIESAVTTPSHLARATIGLLVGHQGPLP